MRSFLILLAAIVCVTTSAFSATTTAFTFQGQLTDPLNKPLTGSYDMTFKLFDAAAAGAQVGSTITLPGVSVNAGVFSVSLDFGLTVINGERRWLEVAVGTDVMAPRSEITNAPYALYAATVPWSGVSGAPTGLPPSGAAGGDLSGTYPDPTIGADKVGNKKLASDAASLARVSGGAMTSTGTKVGIGEASPNFPLHFGSVLGDKIALWGTTGGHYGFGVQSALLQIHADVSGSSIAFGYGQSTAFTEVMRIKGTGNVGIGTTAPVTRLDVAGTVRMTGFQLGTTATAGQVLTTSATGVGTWKALPSSLPPSGPAGGDLTGTYPDPKIAANAVGNTEISDVAWSKVTGAPTGFPPSGTAGGDLTGSYPNPAIAANAVGNTKLASDPASLNRVSAGTMTSTGGNIGIGTTTPGFPLTFPDTVGPKISLFGQSGNHFGIGLGYATLQMYTREATSDIVFGYGSSASLTETARIKGTGLLSVAGDIQTKKGLSVGTNSLPSYPLQVYGDTGTLDQQQTAANGAGYDTTMWQSFTAGADGTLSAVELMVSARDGVTPWTAALAIYSGEGTGGSLLSTQTVSGDPAWAERVFQLASPCAVTTGQKYTIVFTLSTSLVQWRFRNADVYAGGRANYGIGFDFWFRTYLAGTSRQPALVVQPATLNVGIGTTTPGTKLDVAGTARMTGFQLGTSATAGQVLTADASGVGTWQSTSASIPPAGPAGGDLTGTYPNPSIGAGKVDSGKILDASIALADLAANSVDSSRVVDGSMASGDLASDPASLNKVSGGAMTSTGSYIGIGITNPGFPLSFSSDLGDKIALWGTTDNHYGIGVRSNVLQIHSDDAVSDIVFGYGSSASLTETMRIKGDGNVGIGTITPATKLDVAGTVRMNGFHLGSSATTGHVLTTNAFGQGTWQAPPTTLPPSGPAGGDLAGTYPGPTIGTGKVDSAKILDASIASGDLMTDPNSLTKVSGGAMMSNGFVVGLGTTSPGFPLNFANTLGDKISLYGNTGDHFGFGIQSGLLQVYAAASTNDIAFGYGQSLNFNENVRFKGNGYVGMGVASASITHRLQLPNTANAAGQGQANAWITYSSAKWKENITPIDNALEKVGKLQGVYYDWKPEQGGKRDIGFVAEDVGKVIPEIVSWDEDGKSASGMDYARVNALLVEAVKEQQKQIDDMKREIAALKEVVKQ